MLVPQSEIEPGHTAVSAPALPLWTTREFPKKKVSYLGSKIPLDSFGEKSKVGHHY